MMEVIQLFGFLMLAGAAVAIVMEDMQ